MEDQLWKVVIEGVGNYLIVWGLCLCNSVIVNTNISPTFDRIVMASGSRSLPIIDFEITRQPNVGSLHQLSLIPAGRP